MTTPPPPLALTRICTVVPVLRFARIATIADILNLAHVNDAFRDALESYSKTFWRRLASRPDSSSLAAFFFCRDAFAWVAENVLTDGKLDVTRMEDPPLGIAACHGAVEVVRVCLAAMPECVDVRDRYKRTALHYASVYGHTECVRELLAAGADIAVVDVNGGTALHESAEYGHIGILRLLIAHTDFEKVRDKCRRTGTSPLHFAARNGHAECVRELLAAGADITLIDREGDTALHSTTVHGTTDVVRLLVAHADFEKIRDVRNEDGRTVMDIVMQKQMSEMRKLLLLR